MIQVPRINGYPIPSHPKEEEGRMGAATPTITPRQSEQRLVYCVLRVLRGLQHPPASPSTLQAPGHDTVRSPYSGAGVGVGVDVGGAW
jgi:hypothetical protein